MTEWDLAVEPMFPTRRQFELFCSALEINTPSRLRAIQLAHRVGFHYLGPFITKVAIDMLTEASKIVKASPRRPRVLFIGRDALALGYSIEQLAPGFHNQYCAELAPLSRVLADVVAEEAAEWFPDQVAVIDRYRKPGPHRTHVRTSSAWKGLVDFLEEANVYLDNSNALIILIDTGYKGSIQEMLTASYPNAEFHGLYAFHSAAGSTLSSKKGFALHLDSTHGFGGVAIRDCVIDDPALTFAHHDAIVAVEELLRGESETATMSNPLDGLNPIKVAPQYAERNVRRATLAVHQLAVAAYGTRIVEAQHARPDTWYEDLNIAAQRLPSELHAWLTDRQVEPALRTILDSFVRRADKALVAHLAQRLHAANLPGATRRHIWRQFDQQPTLTAKRALLELPLTDLVAESNRARGSGI